VTNSQSELAVESNWDGGASPYAVGSKKLGMWLFIVADSLTFGACLIGYSYLRLASADWPRPFESSSIANAIVMTFCLLSSSLTMVMAVANAHRGERKKAVRFILLTVLGGLLFVLLHSREWYLLIAHEHVTPFSNPWNVPLFGATFFALTGLHMTHVTIGVIYLSIVATGFGRAKFSAEDVEVSGLYWHFVDLVWMFIFPMVYLLSNKAV
jgi:cytochrome c oxidase subunit III